MTITDSSSYPGRYGAGAAAPDLLDPADGIARVIGDHALYLRLLRRFRDDYQDGAARIRAALDSGDARLAHRMAHTLKGAAGMICAPALHRVAAALEHGLRAGTASQAHAIDALGAALADLLPAIALMLDADAAQPRPALGPQPGKAADRPTARPAERLVERLVDRLAGLLASGDGAAVDLVEGSGAMLKAELGEARFSALALAMNEFDFEGALESLRQGEQSRGTAADR
jgi:HPt (histidine-containing phosphotransfer) domain-containing protein